MMTTESDYNYLEKEFVHKWKEFSNIQKAEYLIIDEDSVSRFYVWLNTKEDEDAWT